MVQVLQYCDIAATKQNKDKDKDKRINRSDEIVSAKVV
jgi:hypothetical protein